MAVLQTIRNLFITAPEIVPGPVIPAPTTTYRVRPLTMNDLQEVLRVNLRCFKDGEHYTKNTFTYLLNEPTSLSYRIVTATDEMAGFICVLINENGAAHITTIGVVPEHRRRNLARQMLSHLEKALRLRRIMTIALEVRVGNIAAQELYINSGYAIVQRVAKYYNDGEDGFFMVKSLV